MKPSVYLDEQESRVDRLSSEDQEEFEKAKIENETLIQDDIRWAIMKTRVWWLAKGEKANKYFLSLENRNVIRKSISKIDIVNDEEITKPKEILSAIQDYFRNIYASEHIDIQKIETWFDELENVDGRKLDNESQQYLDRPLEMWEYTKALKEMTSGKVPGRDGLPVE